MSYRAYTLISYLIVIVSLSFSYPTYSKNEIISKHDYKLYKSNIHFASTTYILSKSESDFTFQIISRTDGIFKLKKDDRKETSVFKKHGDKVDPVSYIFSRKKRDKEDVIKTFFNLNENYAYSLTNGKKTEHMDLEYSLDRLSVQIDYQNSMRNGVFEKAYNIIDKGRLRKYIYTIYSNEVIDSILGKVNAIVIKRSIENNKRSTLTWYAIDYDFIPIKIEQYRKNSVQFTVILDRIK
tara:strand:- start:2641 stop:3354 length:714 start_codon:yes stop_codon:yes gene_type:complete